jgi:8-oxo-dGTP diphosphatase
MCDDANGITVAAAVIRREGRILLTQRFEDAHLGGLWEFPGGKVEDGETLQTALLREIREELGVTVEVGAQIFETTHVYPERTVRLHFFDCRITDGTPRPRQTAAMAWAAPSHLGDFRFPDANHGLIALLRSDLSGSLSQRL